MAVTGLGLTATPAASSPVLAGGGDPPVPGLVMLAIKLELTHPLKVRVRLADIPTTT